MERPFWDTGTVVSASVHGLLVLWLLVGNVFRAEPLPMEVQSVSVISSEDFAALSAPVSQPAPEPAPAPAPPQVSTEVTPPAPTPEPRPAPQPETAPAPQVQAPPEPAPTPPSEDVAVIPPDVATPPPPAERVAPEPVPAPAPEAQEAPERQDAVTEDSTADLPQEPQEQTAPPEATTEIVTEADRPEPAPSASLRPVARPNRPVQTAQPAPEPAAEPAREPAPEPVPEPQEPAPRSDPVADAIAEALANNATPPTPPTAPSAPSGPPLTGSELEGLRVSVSQCWNVGQLSTEAQDTKVTVFVAMNEDGTPRSDSIRMVRAEGGSDSAARAVFETARRAILRCGTRGFPLPVEKYGQWREIEMTFDPEGMFWR